METLAELYRRAVRDLSQSGAESPGFDAMCLLEEAFGISKAQYLLQKDEPAGEGGAERFAEMLRRRKNREPLQYILGKWDFYKYTFFVGEGVLIPRPETEKLVELALREIRERACRVCFDLCAGSGCIGLSVAREHPDVLVWLFEKHDGALKYLRRNADAFSLPNVRVVQYDIFDGFDPDSMPHADLIISNPPYILSGELPGLQAEVGREPREALDGGEDGLMFYRCLAGQWAAKLFGRSVFLLETGENLPEEIVVMFRSINYCAEILDDIYGVPRFVRAAVENLEPVFKPPTCTNFASFSVSPR